MIDSILAFAASGLTDANFWTKAVVLMIVTQLTILSTTLYLHRSATHRAVDFHPLLEHFFRFWVWLTTATVTGQWVAVHRKHHAHCETAEDPHSPQVYGIARVLRQGPELYKAAAHDAELVARYAPDAPKDWLERRIYGPHSSLGPTLLLFIQIALFGASGVVIWAIQMLWIPVFAAGVINGLGHYLGYRNYATDDCSTNLTPLALFIGGEELHNNHHAFPSSAKFSSAQHEIDIGWWAIRALQPLGLARVLRVAPELEFAAQAAEPDVQTLRAVLAHRYQVLQRYYREVLKPAVRAERKRGASLAPLRRRWIRALVDGGRWLDEQSRARLAAWVEARPVVSALVSHQRRLEDLLRRSNRASEEWVELLRAWIADAEASGHEALAQFAQQLTRYRLATAMVRV